MIIVKSSREIELIREASRIVALVFEEIKPMIKAGVSTKAIDDEAGRIMAKYGATSGSKGYYGYPGNICISVNETLVHGIPSERIILREGDIVSLDVVAKYHGYYGDACRTFAVGIISERAKRLVETTEQSFFEAIKLVKEGVYLGDICHAIQTYNESHGYSLPREFTGHGIGSSMHEDPSIPNVGKPGTGPILKAGMTICIEPMVAEGRPETRVLGDGWTAKMKDGKLSAHYENTILVTKDGCEILTMLKEKENNV